MKLQAWAILGSISTDSRAQCVHVPMASFPPATSTLQRASNDCTILSKRPFYRFDDSTAIFFGCCWLRFRRTCHVVRLWTKQRVRNFRCFWNIQLRSRHKRSRTWPVWFLMAKKKPFGFGACEIFSSLMWPVFFPRNGLENNSKLKSFMWEKGEA